MQFYTYHEDLASALVGPFDSRPAAEAHVAFCLERGDADPGTVVAEGDVGNYSPMMRMTAEEDRK